MMMMMMMMHAALTSWSCAPFVDLGSRISDLWALMQQLKG